MAGTARRITVEFLGNNRDLDNAMDSSARKGGKFGSAMSKVAKVGALGLAAGAVVAGKALFDMTKAAAEDEAAQVRLANTLKNVTGASSSQIAAVEDWITKQGIALGVTDDELRPAMEKLVIATGDVGKAQELASLAMDVSAGSGKSLEQVSTALARAQNGNVGALARLGIATKDAHGKTLSFEQITNKLGNTFEGAASKKANTFQGKMDRLKLVFNETKEEIGAKLLPVVTRLATWFLAEGLPAIQAFGGWLRDNLPPIFEKVKAVVQRVMNALRGDTGGAMKDMKDFIRDAVTVIQFIWRNFGQNILGFLRDTFIGIKNVISGAFKIIRGIFKVFSSLIKGDWKGVWNGVKLILRGAWQVIKGLVRLGFASIKLLFKNAWVVLKAITKAAWDGLKTLVKAGFQKVIDYIKNTPSRIKAFAGLFKTAGSIVIRGIISGLGDFGRNALGNIVEAVRGIPARIRALATLFKNAAAHVLGQMVAGFKGAGGLVSDIAGNVWDALSGLINSAIDKINGALEFTIGIPGPDIHVNPENIPHVFRGGIVPGSAKGSLIVAGDRGHDEAVIPLSGPYAPKGMTRGGDTYVFNISGVIGDKQQVTRWFVSALRDHVRATGQPLPVPVTGRL